MFHLGSLCRTTAQIDRCNSQQDTACTWWRLRRYMSQPHMEHTPTQTLSLILRLQFRWGMLDTTIVQMQS